MSDRLTDEDLDQLIVWADKGELVEAGIIRQLVAEVRRLRSDEWLGSTEEELKAEADREGVRWAHGLYVARTERHISEEDFFRAVLHHDARAYAEATAAAQRFRAFGKAVLAILRKHRDGRP